MLPVHYGQLPDLFRCGVITIDVVLVQLAPPDGAGRYSLGLAEDYLTAAIDAARVVIAEVNDQIPQTSCGRMLTEGDLDVVVYASRAPAEVKRAEPGSLELRIAKHVAGLVEDGSTLQFGIGKLPEAILARLANRRDLGVHSGLINDTVADLMEAGVITNALKSLDRGKAVAGLLMGSQRLFSYAHRNPAIELRETRYTHNPEVLAAQEKLVAINSAIEVDLSGQVTAAMMVQTGAADVVLTGGVESMSNIEYYTTDVRWGRRSGGVTLYDRLDRGRERSQPEWRFGRISGMIETAENLSKQFEITREAADEFAARSH